MPLPTYQVWFKYFYSSFCSLTSFHEGMQKEDCVQNYLYVFLVYKITSVYVINLFVVRCICFFFLFDYKGFLLPLLILFFLIYKTLTWLKSHYIMRQTQRYFIFFFPFLPFHSHELPVGN